MTHWPVTLRKYLCSAASPAKRRACVFGEALGFYWPLKRLLRLPLIVSPCRLPMAASTAHRLLASQVQEQGLRS